MNPTMTLGRFRKLLASHEPISVILDTDAYNEVDDQFCIAYCMRAPDRVRLLSINAAPFLNARAESAADGMERSYREILKVMALVNADSDIPVYRGSPRFMQNVTDFVASEAVENIIRTVDDCEEPVVILAIGAITNVASALVKRPDLAQKTAVIWLGGHALHHSDSREFNMVQDVPAAQVVFDSGIPLLQIPCKGVCTEFRTSPPELEYYLRGKSALCDYLIDNVSVACRTRYASSRVIWDVTAAATLICPAGCEIVQIPRPRITAESCYSFDNARPHYLYVRALNRDLIYGDLFRRLIGEA